MAFGKYVFAALICLLFRESQCKVTAENCEVCIRFVNKLIDKMGNDISDVVKIENEFKSMCKISKDKEERLCYYIGGLEISATYIVNELTKPLSWGMPADKICEKLKAKDSQVCDLRYEKLIDLKTANLKKLKVRDLRKVLEAWGEGCDGCAEKSDYIKLILEKMPKHDPESHAARSEL